MGDVLSRKTIGASQPRHALITGAAGLLGRHIAARLCESLWQVTALSRQQLDITRETDVRAAIETARPDVIINCAVTGDVDRCEREPDWATSVNTEGPRLLARACRDMGIEIVHVSTDYVFDGSKEGFYTEQDEPRPLSVYGHSKLAGEAAVWAEIERAYIIRTSWIFGAGGRNFGSRVIEYARRGLEIKCVTDQTSITTYAPDLARRIEEIINRGEHGLYHVTSTGATSWHDFAREALTRAGLGHIEIIPVTRADLRQLAPRPRNTAMKSLLSERLGLAPLRHWRDALPEFIKEG
jgi:dTDP-4-dehydrorhamnose reductase